MKSAVLFVQNADPRPALAAVQQTPMGPPPEPAQMKMGFPSFAACLRASHTLVRQGTRIQCDSPGWGWISA